MTNYVNNIAVDHATPGSTVPVPVITTETTGTPKELYRCTDDKIFTPTLIVADNVDTTNYQHVRLVDADLTDAGIEDDNKDEAKFIYSFTVAPDDTTILTEKELAGLHFRYGVCGYNSISGTGTRMYIAGGED